MPEETHYGFACDRRTFLKETAVALALISCPAISLAGTSSLSRAPLEGARTLADPLWTRESIRLMWSERKRRTQTST